MLWLYCAILPISALLLLLASISDIKTRRVSDLYSGLIFACGVLLAIAQVVSDAGVGYVYTLGKLLVGAVLCAVLFAVPAVLSRAVGGADVKIACALGFLWGFPDILTLVFVATFSCGAVGIVYIIRRRRHNKEERISLPMFPFFAAAHMLLCIVYFIKIW